MSAEDRTTGTVQCFDCPEIHVAEFHHIGHGGQRVFAVVCGEYVEMYMEEVVRFAD